MKILQKYKGSLWEKVGYLFGAANYSILKGNYFSRSKISVIIKINQNDTKNGIKITILECVTW